MTDYTSPNRCDELTIERIERAMRVSDEQALDLLDQALSEFPADPRLTLLRGSIHAQHGRYTDAFADLSRTVVTAPKLHAARFMLGYLELCHQGADRAIAVWQPLAALPDDVALASFARGLTALAQGHPERARQQLQRGLAQNQDYPELMPFVQALLEKTKELDCADTKPQPDVTQEYPESAAHLLLGGYLDRRDH